jgi:hypothetical protein
MVAMSMARHVDGAGMVQGFGIPAFLGTAFVFALAIGEDAQA